jgi:hypothetical protein
VKPREFILLRSANSVGDPGLPLPAPIQEEAIQEEVSNEARRVHHAARWLGSVAARGARAAGGDAGGRRRDLGGPLMAAGLEYAMASVPHFLCAPFGLRS